MEDFERYIHAIIEPTVDDFRRKPSSVRLGFLTCVAIDHSIDYLAFPRDRSKWDGKEHRVKRRRLREQYKIENEQFRIASEVANAFKHVKTTSNRGLEVGEVYERPSARAGRARTGISRAGDKTGAVVVDGRNLLRVVNEALNFLHSKMGGSAGRVSQPHWKS